MKRTIGEQVAQYMADHGLKAAAMAQRAGTSRQNIEGLVKRDRYPRDYIDRLAAAMGISIDDLHAGNYKGIEEKLELPHGFLDQASGEMSRDVSAGSSMIAEGVSVADTGSDPSQSIPTSMPYEPRHLKSAILLMGSLLGALDRRSKRIVGELLKELAEDTDDAADIAEKASVLATVQKPISKNKALNKAIQGRGDPVETGPAPLEHK